MRHTACLIVSLVVVIQTSAAGQPEFFQSIRNDDLAAISLQLQRGADLVRAKDSAGATALMYAEIRIVLGNTIVHSASPTVSTTVGRAVPVGVTNNTRSTEPATFASMESTPI